MQPVEHLLDLGDVTIAARDWGGPPKAPALLMVHGLASNARIWDLTAPQLAAERRVVAIDQRGHGRSAKPDVGYDLPTAVHDLAGAITALGLVRPLVVGHSWGANVALQLAAEQPGLVAGVVLVDGGTTEFAATMGLEEALERLAPPRLAGTPRDLLVGRIRLRWPDEAWRPEIEHAILGNFAIDSADRLTPHLTFERHLELVRAMWHQRPTQVFPRVGCPVLIIPVAPQVMNDEAAQWMALKRASVAAAEAGIPRARVVWAHDSIHDLPLHRPEFLANRITEFAYELVPYVPPGARSPR
ncbi:MAG TPA: alpha/beta hydrolase [Roseiflexaceae bacterium]|nr:alpha/beta hydrolase [Roseiflexaceae bacterium]HMP39655.1 alpha/beta hydrolase [Roseiflexaceae bacterium]